ncbi:YbjN domain-containing protein [Actinomyces sp. 2119]|uniref:YbjN domain-containing protein n=1 Tax=Actinomyces lilanjuaniae TaxID=2321394 RepID=A0ABN5PNW6_9ACTO|nr:MULTISPECIES: YbjN domain-containing protein [Actinomyces]AYD90042.1 YbjN domain-containing protein [Actinomyces lilanjuaniae]RJF42545.1 YbjN domain-containing protein [Actinomyces sp. 2119]
MVRRKHRLGGLVSGLVARLLGKEWDLRAQGVSAPGHWDRAARTQDTVGRLGSSEQGGGSQGRRGVSGKIDRDSAAAAADSGRDVQGPGRVGGRDEDGQGAARQVPQGRQRADRPARQVQPAAGAATSAADGVMGPLTWSTGIWEPRPSADTVQEITLSRVRNMLTGPMGYRVQDRSDHSQPHLLGVWDSFPFVIEIPEGHDGWLLVSGDWEEAGPLSQRDEIAASVNDWNRDKFFPTVGVVDSPTGPLVRATYLMDLGAGVTDNQLRIHLGTALSACTQALTQVGPLLPEL